MEECVDAVLPTAATSWRWRTPTPRLCVPYAKLLPLYTSPTTCSTECLHDDSKPSGFPGAEETSQKIKYNYGNYDDYLLTVCECAGLDLERKSIYEESMEEGLRCFAQGCLW